MKQHLFFIISMLAAVTLYAGSFFTDTQLGYTITLPEHWVVDSSDGTHVRFRDTSRTYTALIAIERHDFSADTVFSQAEEWTRANFIAYIFVVDADPFSSLLFYDTVSSRQSDVPWSTEAYSVFYDPETSSGDLAEYIRFTATGTYGYEIYAIGSVDDMNEHVGMYAAIIQGVTIIPSAGVVTVPVSFRNAGAASARRNARYDLLGRTVTGSSLHHHHVSRIITGHGFHSCLFR